MEKFSCEHTLNEKGKPSESNLVMSFTSKEVLNVNSMPRNTFILSKKKKLLRDAASFLGSSWHLQSTSAMANVEKSILLSKKNAAKSSARKKMNKDKIAEDEQNEVFAVIDNDFLQDIDDVSLSEEDLKKLFLYDSCSLSVGVSPPSRRIVDPPNFHPTLKPIIDGLTDALWWEDDNFNYITSTEFHHVEPNKEKLYIFYISIKDNALTAK